MGLLGRIENWLEKRKNENNTTKVDWDRRKNVGIFKAPCKHCGHEKQFYYSNAKIKCCKCGTWDKV